MSQLAIITGATRGLGFALTQRLLTEGMNVVAMGRQVDNLKHLQEKFGLALQTLRADLGTLDGIRIAGADLQRQINGEPVQYLVNGAGIITPIGPIHTIDLADFSRLINVNFFATFHLTNVLVPQFAKGARVLSISSRAAEIHIPGLGMYCVSKAALESLTGSYQTELAGVSVTTCIPGEVDTAMQTDLRNGPEPPPGNSDRLRSVFDLEFFHENKKRLIPPETAAKFLHWLLTGPGDEEFESQQLWTIYNPETQARWLEAGKTFPYEAP